MKRNFLIAALCMGLTTSALAQQPSYIEMLDQKPEWVEKTFRKLSKKQKIAQMFFVAAYSNKSERFTDSIAKVIKKERVGGLVFFQGGPGRQAVLTNEYQKKARIPLLIASDGEWGLGMRLDSTISYPYQMALGAVQNKDLIYKMGLEVAKDYRRIGMHMNLAPDVDVNNNAKNPVINYRSFGENKYNVTEKAAAYLKGMQDGGLLVSIKHYPGHGDTDVDSHYDLPQLKFSKERLDSLEMYPFKELIKQGAAGVMIAHMNIPSLDPTPNVPSTLSKPIVTQMLKEEQGFKGIVISDAMGMKGVVKHFKDGEADVMGIMAGNDILELSENSKRAIKLVYKAVKDKRISMDQIDASVKKILTAKYWAGLNVKQKVNEDQVFEGVNRPESKVLLQQLADASMTLVRGKEHIASLSPNKRVVLLDIGIPQASKFQSEMQGFYKNSISLSLDKKAVDADIQKVLSQILPDDQVVIAIHDSRTRPGNNIPLTNELKNLISNFASKDATFVLFANPYNLAGFQGIENAKGLLVAYQKEDFMQISAASVLKHQLIPTGKLPITGSEYFKYGQGE